MSTFTLRRRSSRTQRYRGSLDVVVTKAAFLTTGTPIVELLLSSHKRTNCVHVDSMIFDYWHLDVCL
jgi:hypothetical protein